MAERDLPSKITSIWHGHRIRDEKTMPRVPGIKEALEEMYTGADPTEKDIVDFLKEVRKVQRKRLPQRIARKLNPFKK